MGQDLKWDHFYTTLNRLGPRFLTGLNPGLVGWVEIQAEHSDSFWSESLQGCFELWDDESRAEAVRSGLEQWCHNVCAHLRDVFGPFSLIPFDTIGISDGARQNLVASVDDIEITIDDESVNYFINYVVLDLEVGADTPQLSIQGVIVPYGNAPEGKLIRAMALPWQVVVDALVKDWSVASQIPYDKWEEMIAGAFDRAGYDEVTLTPRSGDHGRDVIAVKKGVGSIRIIGSVKAYKPGHLVKHDDVRALAGVLHGDLSASKGIITTTSSFAPGIVTDPFLSPLMPYRLELMDGKALKAWLQQLSKG